MIPNDGDTSATDRRYAVEFRPGYAGEGKDRQVVIRVADGSIAGIYADQGAAERQRDGLEYVTSEEWAAYVRRVRAGEEPPQI
jgi:hypothetical protein